MKEPWGTWAVVLAIFTISLGDLCLSQAPSHPLDPLSEAEINATSALLRNFRTGNWLFNYITLQEPVKSALLPSYLTNTNPPTGTIPRRSFSVMLEQTTNRAYEAIVNLNTNQVESWTAAPSDVIPTFTPEDMLRAERITRENNTVIARCRAIFFPLLT